MLGSIGGLWERLETFASVRLRALESVWKRLEACGSVSVCFQGLGAYARMRSGHHKTYKTICFESVWERLSGYDSDFAEHVKNKCYRLRGYSPNTTKKYVLAAGVGALGGYDPAATEQLK